MIRTIYNAVTGSSDGRKVTAGGKKVSIIHLQLGKITKRSDGRFQAGYRDVYGTRKFITCRTEEEVLARFQALQPTVEVKAEVDAKRDPVNADTQNPTPVMSSAATPDKDMLVADYALKWLETFKWGKIRPNSYERYQFCLQLLCKDEIAHMDVREIRLEHIQGYVNRLEDMSASTIKRVRYLSTLF